jgi:hypothetical protein
MALLEEYAITPDVFDMSFYANEELGDVHLKHLKEVILNEGLVRNLRNDKESWTNVFNSKDRPWHKKGLELLKKLVIQNRICSFDAILAQNPVRDEDWCDEALASHIRRPLTGIMTSASVARSFKDNPLVSSIEKLPNARWWQNRSPSIRLKRVLEDYQDNLYVILQTSRSIMFIDPHLDPGLPRYHAFTALLSSIPLHRCPPLIEIHRVCYTGSGKSRSFPEWQKRFQDNVSKALTKSGHSVDVFIWDDFHDRYLISDLVGISLPYGFDTTLSANNKTTWTRLGRSDRDDVALEFDKANPAHKLIDSFTIP